MESISPPVQVSNSIVVNQVSVIKDTLNAVLSPGSSWLLFDEDGACFSTSDGAEKWFGDQLRSQHWSTLMAGVAEESYQQLAGLFSGDGEEQVPVRVVFEQAHSDAALHDVECDASVIAALDRPLVVVTLKSQSQLQKLRQELSTLQQDFADFAYSTSHDLNVPINVIGGYVELLQKKGTATGVAPAPDLNKILSKSVTSAKSMMADLLTYSRLNTMRSPAQKFSILEVIGQVLGAAQIGQKPAAISLLDVQEVDVYADRKQVKMMFAHLVDNALKFRAPERKHLVTIQVEKEQDDCIVRIQDNGIGIAEVNQERIWGLFQCLHPKGAYDGNGIGLTLCKKICQLNDVIIALASQLDSGTTVTVRLPCNSKVITG